jgi:hypothetical protein
MFERRFQEIQAEGLEYQQKHIDKRTHDERTFQETTDFGAARIGLLQNFEHRFGLLYKG